MKDLESELRDLPLRSPSRSLDERVLGQQSRAASRTRWTGRVVPLRAAVLAVAAGGVLGYLLGIGSAHPEPIEQSRSHSPVLTRVIYRSVAASNPFDFTVPYQNFAEGDLEVKLFATKG